MGHPPRHDDAHTHRVYLGTWTLPSGTYAHVSLVGDTIVFAWSARAPFRARDDQRHFRTVILPDVVRCAQQSRQLLRRGRIPLPHSPERLVRVWPHLDALRADAERHGQLWPSLKDFYDFYVGAVDHLRASEGAA